MTEREALREFARWAIGHVMNWPGTGIEYWALRDKMTELGFLTQEGLRTRRGLLDQPKEANDDAPA